jgi:hypothetical protein
MSYHEGNVREIAFPGGMKKCLVPPQVRPAEIRKTLHRINPWLLGELLRSGSACRPLARIFHKAEA